MNSAFHAIADTKFFGIGAADNAALHGHAMNMHATAAHAVPAAHFGAHFNANGLYPSVPPLGSQLHPHYRGSQMVNESSFGTSIGTSFGTSFGSSDDADSNSSGSGNTRGTDRGHGLTGRGNFASTRGGCGDGSSNASSSPEINGGGLHFNGFGAGHPDGSSSNASNSLVSSGGASPASSNSSASSPGESSPGAVGFGADASSYITTTAREITHGADDSQLLGMYGVPGGLLSARQLPTSSMSHPAHATRPSNVGGPIIVGGGTGPGMLSMMQHSLPLPPLKDANGLWKEELLTLGHKPFRALIAARELSEADTADLVATAKRHKQKIWTRRCRQKAKENEAKKGKLKVAGE
jgi:hypothetical protein